MNPERRLTGPSLQTDKTMALLAFAAILAAGLALIFAALGAFAFAAFLTGGGSRMG